MTSVVVEKHGPAYTYCMDPETCCSTYGPVAIRCAVDGQPWPCETKRSHHTAAQGARIERWVAARLARSYVGEL